MRCKNCGHVMPNNKRFFVCVKKRKYYADLIKKFSIENEYKTKGFDEIYTVDLNTKKIEVKKG